MTREQRLEKILEELKARGEVKTNGLSDTFGVSDMTIRRDLEELAGRGQLIRTHGGGVRPGRTLDPDTETEKSDGSESGPADELTPEASYIVRIGERANEKQQIADLAARLIQKGQRIFLDSGTTTAQIAKCVPVGQGYTYLTNGVNVAIELLHRGCPEVIMIGGEIDLNTWSARGSLAESAIGNFHADIAFLACNAVSPEGAVMVGNASELGLKRKIMSVSRECYLAADSSKFDHFSLVSYAQLNDFSGIVTDSRLAAGTKQSLMEKGSPLIFAGE